VPVQWADVNDDSVITIGFDRDDDPYNGVFARGGESIVTSNVAGDASIVQLDTTSVAGRFHVYAKVTNGTKTRYYYAPGRTTITAAGFDNTWIGPATGGSWSTAANWSTGSAPTAGQKVAIYDSAVTLASNARLADLHLNDTAKLDMRAATLFIDYDDPAASPIAQLTARLREGRTPGSDWSGETGIVSSVAAASGGLTALGIGEAATAVGYSTTDTATFDFAGQSLDCTTVVIKYTYDGDADLNGYVDAVDYGTVDNWIQFPGTDGYCNGDYNLDGVIDAVDYGIMDNSIQLQGPPL
jgi:hypothetical protein